MKTPTETKDAVTWVIRAGEGGKAHDLFTKQSVIALSDATLGDLRLLPKERSAFYDAYASHHPDKGTVAISGIGGKYFRFVHEVKVDDQVLYPCIRDQKLYIGNVTSVYRYDPSLDSRFPHQRSVNWLVSVPKNSLSESAQRELGAARTFFGFKTHVAEIRRISLKKSKSGGPR